MEKKKKSLLILFAVLVSLVVLFFAAKMILTNKIEGRVQDLFGTSSDYEELDVNLLGRQIILKNINYNKAGNSVHAEKVSLNGIGFLNYMFNDELEIDRLELKSPEIIVNKADSTATADSTGTTGSQNSFDRNISIGTITASDGTFKYRKEGAKGNEVFLRFPRLELMKITIDSNSIKKQVPFRYKSYSLKSDSIRLNLNPQHYLTAGALEIKNGETRIKDFRINSYYNKTQFDQNIPYEKDRISLQVDSIRLDSLSFDFRNEKLYLRNPATIISGGKLQVYRNKVLPDDPRKRVLYSQLLRDAPVKLDFPKVTVKSSRIQYEEKMKEQRPPASVVFDIKQANIQNITNVELNSKNFPQTKVHVEAIFQKVTPLSVDWTFNTSDRADNFSFSGKFGAVPGDALNSLLRPSMNMEAKGTIKDAWFNFHGDDDRLRGDVRLNYDRFKFVLLKDGSGEKKGLLTAIANLFVDNDGISKDDVSKDVELERDVHISFWGYVWRGLKSGVRETFSQI